MARYDRIARLSCPDRDETFTGWLMLRDLESRERDADLGRRARARFLAVRLLDRVARQGTTTEPGSLQQQVNAVREELGVLPSRDPDRERLAGLLKHVEAMELEPVVRSALEMADAAQTDGHPYAAEEWSRAALLLARAYDLADLAAEAAGDLARYDGRATA